MEELASRAKAMNKPVFLSLTPLGGDRRHLAAKVVANGSGFSTDDNWSADCFDFATDAQGPQLAAAYGRYVDFMIETFEPKWLNTVIEMNLFMNCGDVAWRSLVNVHNDIYDAVKSAHPNLIVFPSIQIDHLYGVSDDGCEPGKTQQQCFDEHYTLLNGLERDRFAVSTYPFMKHFTPAAVPADWFTRGSARGGEQMLIAETGWLAHDLIARLGDQCVTALEQDATEQADYFDRVLADAKAANAELITWWSNRDVVVEDFMGDCPCDFDATWCSFADAFRQSQGPDQMAQFFGEALLKIFGTMGIRTYEGVPRQPLFDRWQAARVDPVANGKRGRF
jgi:hypothetical protein